MYTEPDLVRLRNDNSWLISTFFKSIKYMYSNNKRFRYITMHLLRYANFPGTDLSVDDHNNYLEGGGVRSAPFKKTKLISI